MVIRFEIGDLVRSIALRTWHTDKQGKVVSKHDGSVCVEFENVSRGHSGPFEDGRIGCWDFFFDPCVESNANVRSLVPGDGPW